MTNLEKALLVEGFEAEEGPYSPPGKLVCQSRHPDAWGVFDVTYTVPGKILAGGYWYEISTCGNRRMEYWAVDSNHMCWYRSGEGGQFKPLESQVLITMCMDRVNDPDEHDLPSGVIRELQEAMGKKPFPPYWVRKALEAGCTFPEDFDLSQYSLDYPKD